MPERAASTHCLVGLGRRDTGREGAKEVGLLMDGAGAARKGLVPFPVSSGMASQLINGVCCLWHSLGREPRLCVESLVHGHCSGSQGAENVGCVSILGDPGRRAAGTTSVTPQSHGSKWG